MTSAAMMHLDFFKVFLPDRCSERMYIPKAFANETCLQEKLPEDVILKYHRSGRIWHVKARHVGDKMYFADGWKQFREENLLEAADFLVFTYYGSNVFTFKILGGSGCEKIMVNEEDEQGDSSRSSASMAEVDAELCVHPDNPYFVAKPHKRRPNELHIPRAVIQDFSLSVPEKITLLCCHCQDIPSNELQAYHLSLSEQTLNHKKHLEETGEVHVWRDGRVCVRGWKRFSRKNKIKEKNVCICEVILGEDEKINMVRVHVRPA